MSSTSFFVKGRIQQDVSIDVDIAEITKIIKAYEKKSADTIQRLQKYTSPELAEHFMKVVKILNNGIELHQKRLSTLEKIKNNQMISQSELDHLVKMPVFQKYEGYCNIDRDLASRSSIG